MRDFTNRIKNLSIALEAVSRINYEGSADLFDQVQGLLANEIIKQQEENLKALEKAEPIHNDDDIPF